MEHKTNDDDSPTIEDNTNGIKKDAFIITNEDDPSCTHKIQVRSILPIVAKRDTAEKNDQFALNGGAEEDMERFEIVKNNDFLETVGDGNAGNGSVCDGSC